MSTTVCLTARTLHYLEGGGGHLWVYLNWALGLRANGVRVIWMEAPSPEAPPAWVADRTRLLAEYLEPYGLADSIALCSWTGAPLPEDAMQNCLDLDAAAEADLLLNIAYGIPDEAVARFRRSALLDIDPGLLQTWVSKGDVHLAEHDVYFSIGETVGRPEARFPDLGVRWQYSPPCVSLDAWPVTPSEPDAPFTTITHWAGNEWMADEEGLYSNDKRAGFEPYFDLPSRTRQPLELAVCLDDHQQEEWDMLRARGWRLRHAWDVSYTPPRYRDYVQSARGEFSCVKPSCVRFQNAWISDRTLCFLASGKPAVVEHTGPSRFLPDDSGLLRFRDVDEAVTLLERVSEDYEGQCRSARALAEEHFDASKVAKSLLERALS
jgi:hypothetical protein